MRCITTLFVLLMIASAADRDLSGHYSGEWKSNSAGGSGSFRLSLEQARGAAWKCEIVLNGKSFDGRYQTTGGGAPVDDGTSSAAPVK